MKRFIRTIRVVELDDWQVQVEVTADATVFVHWPEGIGSVDASDAELIAQALADAAEDADELRRKRETKTAPAPSLMVREDRVWGVSGRDDQTKGEG